MPINKVPIVSDHPAAQAWLSFSGTGQVPAEVVPLRENKKVGVFRLAGCGVVAKRASLDATRVERLVYEDILPQLPVDSILYHGSLIEDAVAWLFLEDVGDIKCSLGDRAHVALASHWIGEVHRATMDLVMPAALPDHSLDYYRGQVPLARARIAEALAAPEFAAHDRQVLAGVLDACDSVEACWPAIVDRSSAIPLVLVHGDIKPKNFHIREGRLCVFDWEHAGRGLAPADLGPLNLAAYRRGCASAWPVGEWHMLLGVFLRYLQAMVWATEFLAIESWISRLDEYREELCKTLAAMDLRYS